MKKILVVVLLVLTAAGGVFAQEQDKGTWSVSGKATIGTFIDIMGGYYKFDPLTGLTGTGPGNYVKSAMSVGSSYNYSYDWWDRMTGAFNVKYALGGLSATLGFDLNSDDRISGNLEYKSDTYQFQASTSIAKLIGSVNGNFTFTGTPSALTAASASGTSNWVNKLWGSYNMLKGLVYLEAAYRSRDTSFWTSDTTAGIIADNGNNISYKNGDTYTKSDNNNYLVADLRLENLSFGIKIPRLFGLYNVTPDGTRDFLNPGTINAFDSSIQYNGHQFPGPLSGQPGYRFVDQVLMQSVIGLKFDMAPIQFAAQFKPKDYGLYFGGTFTISQVKIGLSFSGLFPDNSQLYYAVPSAGTVLTLTGGSAQVLKVGGSIDYNAGAFGANIKGYYGINGVKNGWIDVRDDSRQARGYQVQDSNVKDYSTRIRVEPSFFYNVIPTHLKFQTAVRFDFNKALHPAARLASGAPDGVLEDLRTVIWRITPALFWNFKGTGAGGWDTGMAVRYIMERQALSASDQIRGQGINEIDVTFKWNF